MTRALTAPDVDTTDPRKLAEAVRRRLKHELTFENTTIGRFTVPFAAALLAVVELNAAQCHGGLGTAMATANIRAAARAYIEAGGRLEIEEG